MGSFVNTVGTTTPLAGFDEIGITYLAATNTGWLPYLANEGVRFVHYPANRVRRQFGLDQDIPNNLSFLMESPTSVRPFLRHTAFDFWRQHFSAVTVLGSLREGLCTPAMHGYWQAVMTSFEQDLVGSRSFSLIPPKGLDMVVSPDCSCLPSPCWHMPGNKTNSPSLNGMRRRKDGIGIQVFILQVGKGRLK